VTAVTSMRQTGSLRRRALAASTVLLVTLALAACTTPDEPDTTPMPVPTSSASPSASASATPAPPAAVLDPAGSAAGNQAFFDSTMAALLASTPDPDGRTIIDALVAAGFDKATMELTADKTAIGLDADSVQFTVRFADGCIVGQQGNIGYHSAVLPVLSTGKCLIGQTRAINW